MVCWQMFIKWWQMFLIPWIKLGEEKHWERPWKHHQGLSLSSPGILSICVSIQYKYNTECDKVVKQQSEAVQEKKSTARSRQTISETFGSARPHPGTERLCSFADAYHRQRGSDVQLCRLRFVFLFKQREFSTSLELGNAVLFIYQAKYASGANNYGCHK